MGTRWERWREKRKGKLKRRWERWLAKQDEWTQSEIIRRDEWLENWCLRTFKYGVTANRLTAWSAGLILLWIILYDGLGADRLWLHLLLGVVIGAIDAWDGSQARNNDNVTGLGALGDHFRDLAYVLYMERIALDYGLSLYPIFAFIVVELFTLYFKWCAFYKYAGGLYGWEKLAEFAEDNFQNTVYDRWQGIFICVGLAIFGIGASYKVSPLEIIGMGVIWISIGIGIMNLYKEMKWKPLPPVEPT